MRRLLCLIGCHKWEIATVRDGDDLYDWAWCTNIHCPNYSLPMIMNIEYRPLREGDRA